MTIAKMQPRQNAFYQSFLVMPGQTTFGGGIEAGRSWTARSRAISVLPSHLSSNDVDQQMNFNHDPQVKI